MCRAAPFAATARRNFPTHLLSAPEKVTSAASRRACPGGPDGGDKPRRSPGLLPQGPMNRHRARTATGNDRFGPPPFEEYEAFRTMRRRILLGAVLALLAGLACTGRLHAILFYTFLPSNGA